MKKVLLVLVIFVSCKKEGVKPTPVPTPVPVVNHYQLNVSMKPAAYTQTATPFSVNETRDSSYFKITVNGSEVESLKAGNQNQNVVLIDSVKTGDKINIFVRMRTYTKNAKDCVFILNKVWLMSPENVLSSAQSVTVPVVYTDSVGVSDKSWEFTAP
jgi:hypothetical protein